MSSGSAFFAPDGDVLVAGERMEDGQDILLLSVDRSRPMRLLLTGEKMLANPEVSKDGKWIAYQSDPSGQFEVYVRPYPNVDSGRWQVSSAGGKEPLWSPDGRELYYRDFTGALMAVPVRLNPTFAAGAAKRLIDGSPYRHQPGGGRSARTYDISRDGRFLMIKLPEIKPLKIVVTRNWFTELNAQLPVD